MADPKLEDVDSLFSKSTIRGSDADPKVQTDEVSLGDIDPIFKQPTAVTVTATPKPAVTRVDPLEAAAYGAATGAAASFMPIKAPRTPSTTQAETSLEGAQKAKDLLDARVVREQGTRLNAVDEAFQRLQGAKSVYGQTQASLDVARQAADRLGVSLTPAVAPGEVSAGDKWSAKVVGAMGPGADSVTEAARNYQTQQTLTPSEAARFKVGREGIILPNTIQGEGPFFNQQQNAAHSALTQAQKDFSLAQTELNKAQSAHDKLQESLTRPTRATMRLSDVEDKAAIAAAKLAKLQSMAGGPLTRVGQALNKVPGLSLAGGASTMGQAAEAANAYNAEDYPKAAAYGTGALGSAMATYVPHFATKAVGTGMAMAPLAYEAYRKAYPYKSVMEKKP